MALILLLIVLACVFVVKTNDKAGKASQNKKEIEYDTIRAQIELDINMEAQVKDKFYQDRFSHLESMSEDMRELFGEHWSELFKTCECYRNYHVGRTYLDSFQDDFYTHGFVSIWNMAYQIWLSRQGYIPSGKTMYNVMQGVDGIKYDIAHLSGRSAVQEATSEVTCLQNERRTLNLRACKVIEQNMQKAHPGIALRLCNGQLEQNKPCLVWTHWYCICGITPISFPW